MVNKEKWTVPQCFDEGTCIRTRRLVWLFTYGRGNLFEIIISLPFPRADPDGEGGICILMNDFFNFIYFFLFLFILLIDLFIWSSDQEL